MSATTDFDAVVIGSGITGGFAAKELTEKGLTVLVLERGKPLRHRTDYTTEHLPTWRMPDRNLPNRELYAKDYYIQRQARGFDYTTLNFWNNDRENPYVQAPDQPFNWFRGGIVGGRSILWGRQCYRWSDLDFGANRRDGHGNDWPIRYADLKNWYSYVERIIACRVTPRIWHNCRMANSSRPWLSRRSKRRSSRASSRAFRAGGSPSAVSLI